MLCACITRQCHLCSCSTIKISREHICWHFQILSILKSMRSENLPFTWLRVWMARGVATYTVQVSAHTSPLDSCDSCGAASASPASSGRIGAHRRHMHHRGEERHLEPNQKRSLALAKEKLLLVMTRPCHTENLERRAVLAAARVASLPGNKKESVLVTKVAE